MTFGQLWRVERTIRRRQEKADNMISKLEEKLNNKISEVNQRFKEIEDRMDEEIANRIVSLHLKSLTNDGKLNFSFE